MAERTRRTYGLELQRAAANGVLEAAGGTFLLLIAVCWFEAGATAKALVASGGSFGLLLTPVAVSRVARWGWPAGVAASRFAAVGAATFVVMALCPWLPVYVLGSVIAMAAASVAVPLMTQIYQENYPEAVRGKLFSHAVMVRIGMVALFSAFAGRFLSGDIDRSRWLLLIFALAFVFASDRLKRYPSRRLVDEGGSHPFRALRFARHDRLFRKVLIAWMIMGFANLMMLPMRVEYLANPRYGLGFDVREVALLVGVVPSIARLLMSRVWGWLFDRLNFFLLRTTLNLFFAAGILTFFLSGSTGGLIAGAVIFGVANAGGDIAWGLWVMKFAPPNNAAEYMSVHTFFTGVRGVIAPLLAFNLASGVPLGYLAGVSAFLILVSTTLLAPHVRFERSVRPGGGLTEEISE